MIRMNYSFRLKNIIVYICCNDISFYLEKFTENIGIIGLMRSNRNEILLTYPKSLQLAKMDCEMLLSI